MALKENFESPRTKSSWDISIKVTVSECTIHYKQKKKKKKKEGGSGKLVTFCSSESISALPQFPPFVFKRRATQEGTIKWSEFINTFFFQRFSREKSSLDIEIESEEEEEDGGERARGKKISFHGSSHARAIRRDISLARSVVAGERAIIS
jgi:hypothetical protein